MLNLAECCAKLPSQIREEVSDLFLSYWVSSSRWLCSRKELNRKKVWMISKILKRNNHLLRSWSSCARAFCSCFWCAKACLAFSSSWAHFLCKFWRSFSCSSCSFASDWCFSAIWESSMPFNSRYFFLVAASSCWCLNLNLDTQETC